MEQTLVRLVQTLVNCTRLVYKLYYEKQVAVRDSCKIRNNCYSIFGSLDNGILFYLLAATGQIQACREDDTSFIEGDPHQLTGPAP